MKEGKPDKEVIPEELQKFMLEETLKAWGGSEEAFRRFLGRKIGEKVKQNATLSDLLTEAKENHWLDNLLSLRLLEFLGHTKGSEQEENTGDVSPEEDKVVGKKAILAFIESKGASGATVEEMRGRFGVDGGVISRRLNYLLKIKEVKHVGTRRKRKYYLLKKE